MAWLLTTLWYRLKLALSCRCYPWLKSGSKCTHFTKAAVKWDQCSGARKGPCCVELLLQCSIGKCFFHAFFSPLQVCHLAVPHLWVSQHRVSGQEWVLTLLIYKTMWMKSIQRLVQKHLMFVAQRLLFSFQTWENFLSFFPSNGNGNAG